MDKKRIIKEVRRSLKPINIHKVILFGSYSIGNQNKNSDIDLLVVTNDNFVFQSFKQKIETKIKIAQALESLRKEADIDLIVHTKPMHEKFLVLNSGFKKEVLDTGTVIYEANN
ncbi:MAG: nucleotidyltransferase domain-containing protein [Prolixibacteraceae bacterium]|nr:nucleotidyltransferase domain-containing protein [Prolixibacteraceae bacterium]